MERQTPEYEPNPEKLSEYVHKINGLMDELEVPKDFVTEDIVVLSAEMFTYMYEHHGNPHSETYMEYHNDIHAFNVLRRFWVQMNLMKELFPEEHDDVGYILGALTAPGHDLIRGTGGGKGEDEQQSAALTCQFMRRYGFGENMCRRVTEMIETTEVTVQDGTVIQTNIRSGSKDKMRLQLAIADINGIAMEGIPTMISDSFDLCLETRQVTVDDLVHNPDIIDRFLTTQAKFVEERLAALQGDFEYYYGDRAQMVSQAYETAFTGATRHAKGAAHVIYRFPELRHVLVEHAVQQAALHAGNQVEKLAAAKAAVVHLLTRLTPKEADAQIV